MSPRGALLASSVVAIALIAIAAVLLNVPLIAVGLGSLVALLGVFFLLARRAGKRSGR